MVPGALAGSRRPGALLTVAAAQAHREHKWYKSLALAVGLSKPKGSPRNHPQHGGRQVFTLSHLTDGRRGLAVPWPLGWEIPQAAVSQAPEKRRQARLRSPPFTVLTVDPSEQRVCSRQNLCFSYPSFRPSYRSSSPWRWSSPALTFKVPPRRLHGLSTGGNYPWVCFLSALPPWACRPGPPTHPCPWTSGRPTHPRAQLTLIHTRTKRCKQHSLPWSSQPHWWDGLHSLKPLLQQQQRWPTATWQIRPWCRCLYTLTHRIL